jgi:uridine kinase
MSTTDDSAPTLHYVERAEHLLALLRRDFGIPRGTTTVIAVAGESGSGKSVTAIDLAAVLNRAGIGAAIIHQDDYFVRPPRTNHEYREQDITSVGPQEVQLDLILRHIQEFRAGATSLIGPSVNYPANRFDTRTIPLEGCEVLVVEGTYALMLDEADVRVFLEATYHDTAAARRERNRDIDAPFVTQVLEIEHSIIATQVERADIIISRDYTISRR